MGRRSTQSIAAVRTSERSVPTKRERKKYYNFREGGASAWRDLALRDIIMMDGGVFTKISGCAVIFSVVVTVSAGMWVCSYPAAGLAFVYKAFVLHTLAFSEPLPVRDQSQAGFFACKRGGFDFGFLFLFCVI